jgi:hypothetical protein
VRRSAFAQVLRRMTPEIDKIVRAGRQNIPGMTDDEIKAEMIECLWKAKRTFSRKSGVTFEAYWWSIWLNRRQDLFRYRFRFIRDMRLESLREPEWFWNEDEMQDLIDAYWHHDLPDPPNGSTHLEKKMWVLIAVGATPSDVLILCKIKRDKYDKTINKWRNTNTKEHLQ